MLNLFNYRQRTQFLRKPNRTAPIKQVLSPVVKKAAPVVKKAAPVVKKAAPVVKKAAPVVKKAAPVVKKAAPVVKKAVPVVQKEAPEINPKIIYDYQFVAQKEDFKLNTNKLVAKKKQTRISI